MDSRSTKKVDVNDDLFPVLVLGHSMDGSSTFINYLMGCQLFVPKEDNAFEKLYPCEGETVFTEIGHDMLTEKTKDFVFIKNPEHKMLFCDSPGLYKGYEEDKTQTINKKLAEQVNKTVKQKGVIFFVLSLPDANLNSSFRFILEQLKILFHDVTEEPMIRFIINNRRSCLPKNGTYYSKATSGYLKHHVTASPVLTWMTQEKNWLAIDMLKPDSKVYIMNWLDDLRKMWNFMRRTLPSPHVKLSLHEEKKPPTPKTTDPSKEPASLDPRPSMT